MERRIRRRTLRRLYRIVSRIYRMFNHEGWRVRYARIRNDREFCERHEVSADVVGVCDYGRKILWVDYREDILSTIVHESLHAIYPELREYEIVRLEKMVMSNLSPLQAKRLIRHVNHFIA